MSAKVLAAVVVLVITAAGCSILERPSNEPVAIRKNGSHLEVAFCSDIEASYLRLDERNVSDGLSWSTIWEFEASKDFARGDVLSTDPSSTPLLGETRTTPRLIPGDQVHLFVAHPGPGTRRQVVNSNFYLGKDGLSDRDWLHPDGTVTKSPCP